MCDNDISPLAVQVEYHKHVQENFTEAVCIGFSRSTTKPMSDQVRRDDFVSSRSKIVDLWFPHISWPSNAVYEKYDVSIPSRAGI